MTSQHKLLVTVLSAAALLVQSTSAQDSTPPLTAAEFEVMYTAAIEKRTTAILEALALNDAAKSNKLHTIIMAHYHALRARDEAMNTMFAALGKNVPDVATNRATILPILSKPLHDSFLAKLSADLAPEQVELVKDKMTYNKVKVTHDAYCNIVPGLTDNDKARILAALKEAREEAMDGGSAPEKSAIFQKYKNRINEYLTAQGHDVAKATKEWEAKQEEAKKTAEASAAKAAQPVN
jgi:hypothetical protein